MKNNFKYFISIITLIVIISITENSHAQNSIDKYSDTLYAQILDYDSNATIIREGKSKIYWLQIDTFTVNYYNSAIRGHGPMLDTLVISLHIEEAWDSIRIQQVKNRNTELITELSKIYRKYMDSIEWRGYRITESSFESDIVDHLKRKYPVEFSEKQEQMINQIKRCPDFVHNGIGVFLNSKNPGILEDDIRNSYLAKLEYLSNTIFHTAK